MHRHIRLLVALVPMSLALACAGPQGESAPTATPEAPAEATEATAPSARTSSDCWTWIFTAGPFEAQGSPGRSRNPVIAISVHRKVHRSRGIAILLREVQPHKTLTRSGFSDFFFSIFMSKPVVEEGPGTVGMQEPDVPQNRVGTRSEAH